MAPIHSVTRLLAGTALALTLAVPAFAQDAAEPSEPEGDAATSAPAEAPTEAPAEAPPAATAEAEAQAEQLPQADPATVVATIDGTEVTLGEMIIARSQLPQQYQQLPDDALFEGVLDQIIQQQLLADTVDSAPARVEYALENQRRSLLAGEAVTDIVEGAVTEAAIQERYDSEFSSLEPATEWNASHILVPSAEEAQTVLDRLEGGEAFTALAQELSQDPGSGMNGGNLGWFGPGMMVAPFEEALTGLEAGAVSEPVETQFGWHVIQLNETREQQPPALEEVAGEIAQTLQQEALQARIDELTAEATIDRPEAGEIDPAVLRNLDLLEN